MEPREISTLEWAARAAGWGASDWARLVGGSLPDCAAAFFELERARPEGLGLRPPEAHWAWRFAALPPAWRAAGASLDAARLGELLRGNLAYDDSGIDPGYEGERSALRALCLLRVFRECSLALGQPDPRINSLQRIQLRGWREFPLAAFPGLPPSEALRDALRAQGLGGLFESLGARELARSERSASAWAVILSAAAASIFATSAVFAHGGLAVAALVGASASSAAALPALCKAARRLVARGAASRALRGLGAVASGPGIPGAREALACLARMGGLGRPWEEGARSGELGWDELSADQRREINARRAAAAKESLSRIAPRLAAAESADLEKEVPEAVRLGATPSARKASRL